MFINLRCSKPNGDFYITSSQVLLDEYPDLSPLSVARQMLLTANEYFLDGWNVELTQE